MRISLLLSAFLFVSTTATAHSRHHSNYIFNYKYERNGKVQFLEDECLTIGYNQKLIPQYRYNELEKCLALNPDTESSQNRYTDPDGSLQQAARDKADETLVFDRNHELSESEAAAVEAELLMYSERLYVGESYVLRLNEHKHIVESRIQFLKDRISKRPYGSFYLYFKLGFYKRYLKYVDYKIKTMVAPTYTFYGHERQGFIPKVLEKIDELQTTLGKGIIVEDPYFQYNQIQEAADLGVMTQGAADEILGQKVKIDLALDMMADRELGCDFDSLVIQDGLADASYSSLEAAINNSNPGATILVGSLVDHDTVEINSTEDLTIVSRCDAVVGQTTIIVSSDIIIDGLTIHNNSENGEATVNIDVLSESIHLVNAIVAQSDVDGDALNIQADNSRIWILGSDFSNHIGFGADVSGPITEDELVLLGNSFTDNTRSGVRMTSDRAIALLRNNISNNGSYGLERVGPGTAELVLLGENVIQDNNGIITAGTSSSDISNYSSFLDSDDFGNTTTAGDEGPGVE